MIIDLETMGPWTAYSDPRVAMLMGAVSWREPIQESLLRGQLPWLPQDDWSEDTRGAFEHVLVQADAIGVKIDVREGVALVSHPIFLPIDEVTKQVCERYRIVSPRSMRRGYWTLWRSRHIFWVESAEPFPASQWFHEVPMIRVTRYFDHQTYAVLGLMDTMEIVVLEEDGRHFMRPNRLQKPTKWIFDISLPRWKMSARAASRHIAEALPNWNAYLAGVDCLEREAEAAREEAEREAIRRQIDEDADAGVFDDL